MLVLDQEFYDREGQGIDFVKPKFSNTLQEICNEMFSTTDVSVVNIEKDCVVNQINNDIGKGLFAKKNLSEGSYIPYFGLVMNKVSARHPGDIKMAFGTDYEIDCSKFRSNAYYINHSCDPNAIFHNW